jgi:hypothetical protein
MQIEFEREKILSFFMALKEQADEGFLVIKDNKLSFSAKDGANVCFLDATFNTPTTEEMTLAIDCQKFYSTVNAMKTKMIAITFGDRCHVKGGKIERDIVSLADAAVTKLKPLPPFDFPVWLEVPSIDFVEIIEAIDKIGAEEGALPQRLDLEYDKNKFVVHATNELKETTKSEFDLISTDKGAGSKHRAGFGFPYVLKIAKIIKKNKCENMKIKIGTDYPCEIQVSNEILSLTWKVAPRVEED